MKIRDLRCVEVSDKRSLPNGREVEIQMTLVKLLSDNGIEGFAFQSGKAGHLITRKFKHIVGEDVFAVERIWEKLYAETASFPDRAMIIPISTVDLALWDLIGKSLEAPIYTLLGGYRKTVPVYADGDWDPAIEPPDVTFHRYVKDGYNAVKIHLHAEEIRDLDKCEALIKSIRAAIGEDTLLMVDAYRMWKPPQAIEGAKRLAKFNIFWLEEPVLYDDYVYGCARVRSSTPIKIASGETAFTARVCRDLIEQSAIDLLQFDPHLGGGLTPYRKVAGLAELYHISLAPHGARWPETNSQIVAAFPNGFMIPEFPLICPICRTYRWPELYLDPITAKDSSITLPDKPGFGLELNEATIDEYADQRFE